jgi:hypothetical protein
MNNLIVNLGDSEEEVSGVVNVQGLGPNLVGWL